MSLRVKWYNSQLNNTHRNNSYVIFCLVKGRIWFQTFPKLKSSSIRLLDERTYYVLISWRTTSIQKTQFALSIKFIRFIPSDELSQAISKSTSFAISVTLRLVKKDEIALQKLTASFGSFTINLFWGLAGTTVACVFLQRLKLSLP